jgi:S-adenosylmethionine hydrolase
LGSDILFEYDEDFINNIHQFQPTFGNIKTNLKDESRKETQIKFYKSLAVPFILFESKKLSFKEERRKQKPTSRNGILRNVEGCIRSNWEEDCDVKKELNIFTIRDKLNSYRNGVIYCL